MCDTTEEGSIRKQIRHLLDKNPLLTAKPLCKLLGLDYKKYEHYVANQRYLWKISYRFGLGSKRPKMHNVRAFVHAPKCLNRKQFPEVVKQAVEAGWTMSKNRNRTLIWKANLRLGRIEWFTSGKIVVHVKKPQTMGRVKQLLSECFLKTELIFNWNIANQFLDSVKWKAAHDVFETPERLPYMVIDRYVESHGIRIVSGDSTHPNAIECQWCHPDWLERLELMKQQNIKTLEINNKVIEVDSKAFQRFNQILEDSTKPRKPVSKDGSMVV